MRGLCVDPLNNPPTIRQLRTLGVDGVRLVLFPDERVYAYCEKLQRAGSSIAAVLARESFETDDYQAEAADYAANVSASLWIVGNEPDAAWLPEPSPSSWEMTPSEYADLFRRCAAGIQCVDVGAQLVVGGMVSGQPVALGDYLTAIRRVYGGPIAGCDVHPYGKTAIEARALLSAYGAYTEPDMGLYVMEWNRPAREVPHYVSMLDSVADGSAFFCAGDWMVPPFGLWNAKGKPKAAYTALRKALKGMTF